MRVDDRRGRSESGNGEGCERSAKTKEGTQGKTRQDKTRQEKKRKEKKKKKKKGEIMGGYMIVNLRTDNVAIKIKKL